MARITGITCSAAHRLVDGGDLLGDRLKVNRPECLIDGRDHQQSSTGEAELEIVMIAPADKKDAVEGELAHERVRMLAFPLAGKAAPDHQRRRRPQMEPHPRVSPQ